MNTIAIILLMLRASIILSVFAIGLKATFADATFLFRRPADLLRALLSMNVLMPLAAVAFAAPFDLHPAVKITLLVISVSPPPPILPLKALKAGGTEAYTIGLLVAAAVLSIVVIPLSLEVFEEFIGVSLAIGAGEVAALALTTIVMPLLVGITVRRAVPTTADRMARPIGVLASVLLALSAIPILIGLSRATLSLLADGTDSEPRRLFPGRAHHRPCARRTGAGESSRPRARYCVASSGSRTGNCPRQLPRADTGGGRGPLVPDPQRHPGCALSVLGQTRACHDIAWVRRPRRVTVVGHANGGSGGSGGR